MFLIAVSAALSVLPSTPVEPEEHAEIVASFIEDVGADYERFFSPVCDVARDGPIRCFAADGVHVIVAEASRDDAPDYRWLVMEGDVSADVDPTDDTLMSDTISFDGLDLEAVGAAFVYVRENLPDAPDADYVVFTIVDACQNMSDADFMAFLGMDTADSRLDMFRAVCPSRVEDAGF